MFNFLRKRVVDKQAEQDWTPLQLADHPELWREFVRSRVPSADRIKRFARHEIAPGVTLFSAGLGASTLIVGFCGLLNPMLLLPTPAFLQCLDDEAFDVLMVWDDRQLHFDRGIKGFAGSMEALCRKIDGLAQERGYGAVITYGTSMGGLPALRAGALMRADRAISAGGRFVWHINRLAKGRSSAEAFDPLCDCRKPLPSQFLALHSAGQTEDAEHAGKLAAIIGKDAIIDLPADRHNFLFLIHKKGRLAAYHDEIFNLTRMPDPERLRAFLR